MIAASRRCSRNREIPRFGGNEDLNKVARDPFLRLIYVSPIVSSVIVLLTYSTPSFAWNISSRISDAPGEPLCGVVLFVRWRRSWRFQWDRIALYSCDSETGESNVKTFVYKNYVAVNYREIFSDYNNKKIVYWNVYFMFCFRNKLYFTMQLETLTLYTCRCIFYNLHMELKKKWILILPIIFFGIICAKLNSLEVLIIITLFSIAGNRNIFLLKNQLLCLLII